MRTETSMRSLFSALLPFFISLSFLTLSYGTALSAPTLTSVSPTSGLNGNAVRLTIKGTNFVSGITAKLQNETDTVNLTNVTYYTSTTITAFVPAGSEPPGTYHIVVTNPDGGSATSGFTYLVNGTTTLSSFSPTSGLNGNDVRLTIYGTNFKPGIAAKLENATDTIDLTNVTYYSSTTITAYVPAGSDPPGSYYLVVTNTDGFSGVSSSTYLVNGSVGVNSISPTSGWNQTTHQATLTGTNFKTGIIGQLQNTTNVINLTNVTYYNSTTLTAVVPSGAPAGVYDVVLTNTDGGSGTLPDGYTVTQTLIESTDPNCGNVGDTLKIFGAEFGATQGTSTVAFDGVGAEIYSWSRTEIDAYVPSGATTGPVTVTRGGVESNGVTFTVSDTCGPSDYDIVAFHAPGEMQVGETQNLQLWVINVNASSDPGFSYTVIGTVDGNPVFSHSGTVAAGSTPVGVTTPVDISFTAPNNPDKTVDFTVTVTDDDSDLDQAAASTYLQPSYTFHGFLPPIEVNGMAFELGSVIPVKFYLTDNATGDYITDANAYLLVAQVTDNHLGSETPAQSVATPDVGNQFRYDPENSQYVFNWDTTGLTAGTWRLRIDLGDGIPYTIEIDLR
jgi:IPT/TIG domain